MRFSVDPIWGWWPTTLVVVALLAFVWLTYWPFITALVPFRRRMLLGLRVLAALVIAFALFRPAVEYNNDDGQRIVVAFLHDASRSMATTDMPAERSRRDALRATWDEVQPLVNQLRNHVDVRVYDFDQGLRAVETLESETPGKRTAIGGSLSDLLEQTRGLSLLSTFVLTDGAERITGGTDRQPATQVAAQLARRGVAMYPVPFGRDTLQGGVIDAAVEELLIDPVVFEKKLVPVTARIRATGLAGRTLEVRVLLEDRNGKRIGESGEMKPLPVTANDVPVMRVTPASDNESLPVSLSFTPPLSGEFRLAVQIVPVEGEVLDRNNRRDTLVSVRKGGLKVAYFDVLRSEVKYIRRLSRSDKIQLDFHLLRNGTDGQPVPVPARFFDRGQYDVFLIGDVAAERFGVENLKQLALRVEEGAGLLMMGGYHTFGFGGYASTPLLDLLPVEISADERRAPGTLDPRAQPAGEWQVRPTPAGLSHYVMLIDSPDRNEQVWSQLPRMTHATPLRPVNEFAQVLATSADGRPLLVTSEVGRARVAAWGGTETYLWAQAGFSEPHERFWRQLIVWLARKEFDADQRVWVRILPRAYAPGTPVLVEFGAREEQGTPIDAAEFVLSVQQPVGESLRITGQSQGGQGQTTIKSLEEPGDYWVRADATAAGQPIPYTGVGRFLVEPLDLELDRPAADVAALEQLCRIAGETTDSQIVMPEALGTFLRSYLAREPWKLGLEQARRIPLWDGWPLLLVFCAVLGTEWFLRKKWGLV